VDGHIVEVNASTCRSFGGTKAEIAAADPRRLMGEGQDPKEAFDRLARALEGEDQDFEWIGRTLDGREYPAEVRLRRVCAFGATGGHQVLAISRDSSERKRAEEALRVSDERYRAMTARNQAMKWIIDLADGRILEVTEAAA